MASTRTMSVAMILIVLTALSLVLLPAVHADTGFISGTCNKTKDPTECVAVLSGDPRSTDATSEHDLASIALDLATDTADENRGFLVDIANNNEATPEGDAAAVCVGAYFNAAMVLGVDCSDSMDEGDYKGTSELVASVVGTGDRCEDAYKGVNKKSPVTDMDRRMTQRCMVAGDLIDLLVTNFFWLCSFL